MARLVLALALALSACGSEAPPAPARVEVCTVRLLADGQVECVCVPK